MSATATSAVPEKTTVVLPELVAVPVTTLAPTASHVAVLDSMDLHFAKGLTETCTQGLMQYIVCKDVTHCPCNQQKNKGVDWYGVLLKL